MLKALRKRKLKRTVEDIFVDMFVYLVAIITIIVTLYPVWYSIIMSFNESYDARLGGIYFFPRVFTLRNYYAIFNDYRLIQAFFITVMRTIVGTLSSVLVTSLFAYGLSKKHIQFRKFYMVFGIITMFFNGGLIPTFLLYNNLRLFNTFWVYIFPSLISFFNAILFINFYKTIPDSIEEAARIDGANNYYIFFRIIIPLSTPVFATITLFNGVYHWNDWFVPAYFVQSQELKTLQTLLMEIINRGVGELMLTERFGTRRESVTLESLRYATMVVVMVPITLIYPFLQKYFVKGMMMGSIKE